MAQKPLLKVDVACPFCSSVQKESIHAKTTICRSCSRSYSVEKVRQPAPDSESSSGGGFLSGWLPSFSSKPKFRDIFCFECGHRSRVSSQAKSSICPKCSGHIDLQDFKVTGPFSRNIRTSGTLVVTPKGNFASSKGMVSSAILDGGMSGNLVCKGEVLIRRSGKIRGSLTADRLVIAKRAKVEFLQPLNVRELEVTGSLSAKHILVSGGVKIARKGQVHGDVHAKAFTVDKGGVFHGSLTIGQVGEVQADDSATTHIATSTDSLSSDVGQELGLSHGAA